MKNLTQVTVVSGSHHYRYSELSEAMRQVEFIQAGLLEQMAMVVEEAIDKVTLRNKKDKK